MADALNWVGISEDKMNERLERTSSEAERNQILLETLTGSYSDAADAFYRNNEQLVQSRKNQAALSAMTAKLGNASAIAKNSLMRLFGVQEDGSVLFYCAALGPETGGIAQVHILSQPMEATTGRITLLGCRPGCYVYSYGYQAPLPALQQAALAVREQYNILYSDFYDGLTLTFENGPVT